ncbi:MAG TPA: LysR family transcriptional regulator [Candidatus Elarobacter sp.]
MRQLRAAVEVARERSFTRAAESLGVAQPALSQSIASLERELGLTLFERSSRRVRPTDAGVALVTHAGRILAHVEVLRSEMAEHAGAVRGRLVVGSIQLFSETVLPGVLAAFHRRHPAVDLVLREDVTHPMLATLRDAELDLAIVNVDDQAAFPEFAFETLVQDELAIAAAPGDPLAAAGSTTFAALRDADWVAFRAGSGLHVTLHETAKRYGFTPKIVVESGDALTLRSLVSEGLGIALLPHAFLAEPGPPVAIVALREPPLVRTIALATRRGAPASAAARAFIASLREALA